MSGWSLNRVLSGASAIVALGLVAAGSAAPQTPPAQAASAVAVKRMADGHPDLSGAWANDGGVSFVRAEKDAKGNICVINCAPPPGAAKPAGAPAAAPSPRPPRSFPKYKPEFDAKVAQLRKEQVNTDPALRCSNPGVPRIGPPHKVVQTAKEFVFLYDDLNGPFWRIVPMDKPHREDAEQSRLGDSVGHWEGDTLVIETTSFNDESWLIDNGAFHTENMTVVEKMWPSATGIDYQATVTDPEVLAEPWQMRLRNLKPAKADLLEPPPCIEKSIDKMIGIGSFHDNPR